MNNNTKNNKLDALIKRYPKDEREHLSGDEIFFDSSGHIFKQSFDEFGRRVWTILSNQNNFWGWYFVDSPYVDSSRKNEDGSGLTKLMEPNENTLQNYTIHSKYLSYFINQQNQIILFIYTLKDGLLASITLHQDPTWQHLTPTTYTEWADQYDLSQPFHTFPLINPRSFDPEDSYENDDWTEDLSFDDWNNDVEYRYDFDCNWYTKKEFYEYYGSYIQWGFQHPLNIHRRILLMNLISKETNTEKLNCLIDKLISI